MEKQEEELEHKEYENQALNPSISTASTTTVPTKTPVPRDSESDFTSFLDGSKVNSGALENKGPQQNRSLPNAVVTTILEKTPFPSNLTPFFLDPTLTDGDNIEKLQHEDTPAADPTSVFGDRTKPHFPCFVQPPPSTTLFRLFSDDVVSIAVVTFIHIGPFDPGIAQENGSISEAIIMNVVSATEDGFLTLVRRSYGIKPLIAAMGSCCLVGVIWKGTLYIANLGDSRAVIGNVIRSNKIIAEQLTRDHNASKEEIRRELKSLHTEEFTSCAATIGYPLHFGKIGLGVSILMNRADAFLALVSICNSAINNHVTTAKGHTSINIQVFILIQLCYLTSKCLINCQSVR